MAKNKKVKLTENDCKHTLSSIKKPKPPKTVLINNITDCWPALNEQQISKFEEILKSTVIDKQDNDVSIGLESTLRNIKNKSVKTLLIAAEISPQWFGKHLIAMTLTKDPATKVLIVPQMKDVTKRLWDVPSIIVGFKKEIESFSKFYNELNIHNELLKHYYTVKPNKDVSIAKKKKNKDKKEVPPIVYLKKSESFTSSKVPQKMEFEDSADFISLAKYDDLSILQKKSPSYRPLKVKKVVGNLNRKGKSS